jgi:hypothetical protein
MVAVRKRRPREFLEGKARNLGELNSGVDKVD